MGNIPRLNFLLMYDDEGKQKIVEFHAYGEVVRHIAGVED